MKRKGRPSPAAICMVLGSLLGGACADDPNAQGSTPRPVVTLDDGDARPAPTNGPSEAGERALAAVVEAIETLAAAERARWPRGIDETMLGSAGGELAAGPLRIRVPAGAVLGELRLGLAPRPDLRELFASEPRVALLTEPVQVLMQGTAAVRSGVVELSFDPTAVPAGWTPRLVRLRERSAGSAACARVGEDRQASRAPTGAATASSSGAATDVSADVRRRFGIELAASETGEQGVQTAGLFAASGSSGELFAVVATSDVDEIALVDPDGKTWLRIYVLDRVGFGYESFIERTRAAFERARAAARRLGFTLPSEAIAVTVVNRLEEDGELLAATVNGTHVRLQKELHVYAPYEPPSRLERVVAEAFFHVLQSHSMTEATLRASDPVANAWVLDGSAEWFVHEVYPELGDDVPAGRALAPLMTLGREARPFWTHLEESHPGVTRDVFAVTRAALLRERAREGDRGRDPLLLVGDDAVILPNVLDELLRERGSELGLAYAAFAEDYLLRPLATLPPDAPEDERWPVEEPWEVAGLTGTFPAEPTELSPVLKGELTARAVRLVSPIERASCVLDVPETSLADGEEPAYRDHLAWSLHAERIDGSWKRLEGETGAPGASVAVEEVGPRAPYRSLVLVLVSTGWTKWTLYRPDALPSGTPKLVRRAPARQEWTLNVALDERRPPMSPIRHAAPTAEGERVHCIGDVPPGEECESRFATLQQALASESVEPGDTLLVYPGEHAGYVEVGKPVKIVGVEPGKAILTARRAVMRIRSPEVRVRNLVLVSSSPVSTDNIVSIDGEASQCELTNNVILGLSMCNGVFARGASHSFSRNWIATTNIGLHLSGAPGAQVVDNAIVAPRSRRGLQGWTITPTGVELPAPEDQGPVVEEGYAVGAGIAVRGSGGAHVRDNYVFRHHHGLELHHSDGSELQRNVVVGYFTGARLLECREVSLGGNGLFGHYVAGATVQECRTIRMVGDRIEGLAGSGLLVSDTAYLFAEGCEIQTGGGGAEDAGVGLREVENASLTDCRIESSLRPRWGLRLPCGASIRDSMHVSIRGGTLLGQRCAVSAEDSFGVSVADATLHQIGGEPATGPAAAVALVSVHDSKLERLTLRGNHRAVYLESLEAGCTMRDLDFADPRFAYGITLNDVVESVDGARWSTGTLVVLEGTASGRIWDGRAVAPDGRVDVAFEQVLASYGHGRLLQQPYLPGSGGAGLAPDVRARLEPYCTPYLPWRWEGSEVELDPGDMAFPITPASGDTVVHLARWQDRVFPEDKLEREELEPYGGFALLRADAPPLGRAR